jgi:hypothetical protein
MTFKRTLFLIAFLSYQCLTLGQTKKANPNRKNQFGFAFGFGASKFKISNSIWQQGSVNYGDSLNRIEAKKNFKVDAIVFYQHSFNRAISVRPSLGLTINGAGKIVYNRKQNVETLDCKSAPIVLSVPAIVRIPSKSISPYLLAGITFLFRGSPYGETEKKLPFKGVDLLTDIGIGADITTPHVIISPEIKFASGLLNAKPDTNNFYSNTIAKLNRQSVTFSVYFRD